MTPCCSDRRAQRFAWRAGGQADVKSVCLMLLRSHAVSFPMSLASTDVPFRGSTVSWTGTPLLIFLFWVDSLGLVGLFSERTKDGGVPCSFNTGCCTLDAGTTLSRDAPCLHFYSPQEAKGH
uniref:Uncharacterized protein n=1 Tax=Molossus molossus TaxID=27622 RepID=A0A7J8DQM0_MOLMO|nr:hypothetical protein HJG59_009255 [Molossus molossus]